jgi:hypothetical protein
MPATQTIPAATVTEGQAVAPLTWTGAPTCRPFTVARVDPLPEFSSIEFHDAAGSSFVVAASASVALF